jgi:hypothetical protein
VSCRDFSGGLTAEMRAERGEGELHKAERASPRRLIDPVEGHSEDEAAEASGSRIDRKFFRLAKRVATRYRLEPFPVCVPSSDGFPGSQSFLRRKTRGREGVRQRQPLANMLACHPPSKSGRLHWVAAQRALARCCSGSSLHQAVCATAVVQLTRL